MSIKVEGLKELNRALKELPGRAAKRVRNNATRAGAAVVRKEARDNLKSVANVSSKTARSVILHRHKDTPTESKYSVGADREHFYLNIIEVGAAPHDIKPYGGRSVLASYDASESGGEMTAYGPVVHHPGMPPRPWLRPAFDGSKNKVISAIKDKMWDGIKKEAAKLKR